MVMFGLKKAVCLACAPAFLSVAFAQTDKPNYDESKVERYCLPDVLAVPRTGKKVDTAVDWNKFVRPRLREIFENEIYGAVAPRPKYMRFKIMESGDAFGGLAERRQVRIFFGDVAGERSMDMLLYIPKNSSRAKVPVVFGLNFKGNFATCPDKNVFIKDIWRGDGKIEKRDDKSRAENSRRWPYEYALKRGYAVATVYYGDIYPDARFPQARQNSALAIFAKDALPEDTGSIPVWAWGISRGIDYLESLPQIDSKKIVLIGHSRLGKTSLFAGAADSRAAVVVSNDSGCMGSALSRRKFGETLRLMCRPVGYWIRSDAHKYCGNEENMPIDQHQLMALVAPRPLYIASASEDLWADPKGEFTALFEASKVYALFGAKKLPTFEDFKVEKPFSGDVGYHMRSGKHDILLYDWTRFLDFADMHFNIKNK